MQSGALPAAVFLFVTSPLVLAGSATWDLNPTSSDWNTALNWTPETVPNGDADVATFGSSSETDVSVSSTIFLQAIVFDTSASQYTLNLGSAFLLFSSGAQGIVNESGLVQSVIVPTGLLSFGSGTAGDQVDFAVGGGVFGGGGILFTHSKAGSCSYVAMGPLPDQTQGGDIDFGEGGDADRGTFEIEGSSVPGAGGGSAIFSAGASAGNGIFTIDADSVSGGYGAFGYFSYDSTGRNATFIIRGSSVADARGGKLHFADVSDGGACRIKVFGNGSLDISWHMPPGTTVGSIEGDGDIFLGGIDSLYGADSLIVGSNNLSTVFHGTLNDGGDGGGTGGKLTKVGRGQLILKQANEYTGGTTISAGSLIAANVTGSATGSGPVQVSGGTLGGIGTVSGSVSVGSSTSSGTLRPGIRKKLGQLNILGNLTFAALGGCDISLNSATRSAGVIAANGVMIETGASASISDLGTAALPSGTVFTIVSNTGTSPIQGVFANLPDNATISVGSNSYLVSYEGGDGNDLTLTVQ